MQGVVDEIIISSGEDTDCVSDDEDDCLTFSGAGSADDIIIPTSQIITSSTPSPLETPHPRYISNQKLVYTITTKNTSAKVNIIF